MSQSLVQPVGQKHLAVVRLTKDGLRFEIACFKNKALSCGSRVEKDLDEVLQSHTVYSNVSKGVLAKTNDLVKAFGSHDQTKICLEILEKGELQVAGKERETRLSSQFREIATIVVEKAIHSKLWRPYTITMIEYLMHKMRFAVDPNLNSNEQALQVIKRLVDHFPMKLTPRELKERFTMFKLEKLIKKLEEWNATVVRDESGNQPSVVSEIGPSILHSCEAPLKDMHGSVEVFSTTHVEGSSSRDQYSSGEGRLLEMELAGSKNQKCYDLYI